MSEHWMPAIKLPMSLEQFRQLPRHPAFRYEYCAGAAHLRPFAKHYHAVLDLVSSELLHVPLRPIRAADFPDLTPLFADAFHAIQPFGSLDDATLLEAARQALERTRTGGDGPWIEQASFVALERDKPIGAILITLLPDGDNCDWQSFRWWEPAPPDLLERRLGRPHLTWIFVSPAAAGQGTGTALLAASASQLLRMGYRQLVSTFMIGNDASMLWHWRTGFRLLAYPV